VSWLVPREPQATTLRLMGYYTEAIGWRREFCYGDFTICQATTPFCRIGDAAVAEGRQPPARRGCR
jgi:hypothetical protein